MPDELQDWLRQAYPKGHTKIVRMLVERHRAKVDAKTKELLKNHVASNPGDASIDLGSLGIDDASVGTNIAARDG